MGTLDFIRLAPRMVQTSALACTLRLRIEEGVRTADTSALTIWPSPPLRKGRSLDVDGAVRCRYFYTAFHIATASCDPRIPRGHGEPRAALWVPTRACQTRCPRMPVCTCVRLPGGSDVRAGACGGAWPGTIHYFFANRQLQSFLEF